MDGPDFLHMRPDNEVVRSASGEAKLKSPVFENDIAVRITPK